MGGINPPKRPHCRDVAVEAYYLYLNFLETLTLANAKFFEALSLLEQTISHEFHGDLVSGQESFAAATSALDESRSRTALSMVTLDSFISTAYSDWYENGQLIPEKRRLTVVPLDDVRQNSIASGYILSETSEWTAFSGWVSSEDEPGSYKAVRESLQQLIPLLDELVSQFSQAQTSQANGTLHHDIHYSGALNLLAAALRTHRCWQQVWLRADYVALVFNSSSYHSNYSDDDFDQPGFVPEYLLNV